MTAADKRPAVSGADGKTSDDIASMNLWQKLAAITGEVGIIAKGGKNQDQGYSFIEYAAVAGALRTLFSKYRVVCIPNMVERTEREFTSSRGSKGVAVTIQFEFHFKNADNPDEVETINWTGEAADYGDKATNKAATAALKYCLMRTFNVSEKGDEDPDSSSVDRGIHRPEPTPRTMTIQDALARISALLTQKGFDDSEQRKEVMLKIAGVQSGKDLTGPKLDHVLGVLETTSKAELKGYLEADQTEEVAA